MSTESPSSGSDDEVDIDAEHPLQRYAREYLGPIADFFNADNRYKLRRGIEAVIIVVLLLGLVWWAFELVTTGV